MEEHQPSVAAPGLELDVKSQGLAPISLFDGNPSINQLAEENISSKGQAKDMSSKICITI